MTAAAKHFGKELAMFWQNLSTGEQLLALYETSNMGGTAYLEQGRGERIGIARGALTMAQRGDGGGTWAHPKLAVFFARWLDVRFAVWCDAVIDDILTGAAQVTITKPQASAVMALPGDYEGQFLQQTFSRSFDSSAGCQFPLWGVSAAPQWHLTGVFGSDPVPP